MPKLNVQQNNQNVIQAFKNALAIGRLKGIIASDGNHNFSTSGTNRNLLDNWYFVGGGSQLGDGVFPINQRGQTSYTGGRSIDRWRCWQPSTVTLTAAGLTFATGANADGLFQYFPQGKFESLYGETVTASLLLTDGTLYTATGTASADCWIATSFSGGFFGYICNGTEANFRVSLDANQSISIKAVKLEKGTVSTLANDAPPEYAEELMKCNFYDIMLKTSAQYGYLGYGIADSATSATILIPLPNNMRDATPTITTGGTIAVKGGTSGTHTITGITFKLRVTGGVLVTVATTGLTTGEFCLLQLNNTSSYINISADL